MGERGIQFIDWVRSILKSNFYLFIAELHCESGTKRMRPSIDRVMQE